MNVPRIDTGIITPGIVNTRISSIGNIKYISIAVSSSSSSLQAA